MSNIFIRVSLNNRNQLKKTFALIESIITFQFYLYRINPHAGNGTCQLSSEIIDATRSRPTGTIFDPDFDLYARRNDCVTEPPQQPPSLPPSMTPPFGQGMCLKFYFN